MEETPSRSGLRIVPPEELYADIREDGSITPTGSEDVVAVGTPDGVQYDVVGEDGKVVMRTNQKIIDDSSSQVMTMEEIEALKQSSKGSGKELVAKILESHSALDQKTAYALAKYTLRKNKKYVKRFTVLPLDVTLLAKWILHEKDARRIMEMREEILALIASWSNVHYTPSDPMMPSGEHFPRIGGGRWLVVDETAGLLTAYLAERMGLLYPSGDESPVCAGQQSDPENGGHVKKKTVLDGSELNQSAPVPESRIPSHGLPKPRPRRGPTISNNNTLTVIHALAQPNLSLLHYFSFDQFNPDPAHPLTTHLKTLSWLQLLDPEGDPACDEPSLFSPDEIATWKAGRRSNYHRKRRRWEYLKSVMDETRAGGFDGLVVASVMDPASILQQLVPLLRGAGQVVVYNPHLELLAEMADLYSTERKTAYIANPVPVPSEDFPVDPRLLLAPTIQTARAKSWQVLPGRTHPLMTGRGGADGYLFTATRVLPAEGRVEARGKGLKKRPKESEDVVVPDDKTFHFEEAGDD